MTRALIFVLSLLVSALVLAGAAAAESDHLACISVKDNKDAVPSDSVPVDLSNVVEDALGDCEVKVKLTSVCVPVEKDGGDDPRGGTIAAAGYACYKIKCRDGQTDGSLNVDDQFASRLVTRKKLVQICAPID